MPGVPTIPSNSAFGMQLPATAFGTVLFNVIPPGPSADGVPFMLGSVAGANGRPNWWTQGYFTHVTDLIVTCSTTANIITLQRPLNWTTLGAAMAKNTTAITLTDDPGVYSTNYRYPLPGAVWNPPGTTNAASAAPPLTDNALATNDYICFQLSDGTWHVSMIASGTFGGGNIVMTTGTPNFAAATAPIGTPVFWFGLSTDTSPQTRVAHLFCTPIVSTQKMNVLAGWGGNASAVGGGGGCSTGYGYPTLFPGEPMLVYNPNATATTTVDFIGGFYGKF